MSPWPPILPSKGNTESGRLSSREGKILQKKELKIPASCRVEVGSRLFGKVRLGKRVKVDFNVQIYGPVHIGAGSYLGAQSIIGYPPRKDLKSSLEAEDWMREIKGKKSVRLGKNVIVRPGCVIYSDVELGDGVELGHGVLLREDVVVGRGALIGSGVVVDGHCRIGAHVSIQTGAYLSAYSKVEPHVFLGPHCVLLNDRYMRRKPSPLQGPTVGKSASIGGNAVIMPAVKVGAEAVVGAGAVVTEDVEPRAIVAGVPARKIDATPQTASKIG